MARQYICKICNLHIDKKFNVHIKTVHNYTIKEYHDIHIGIEQICANTYCNNIATFDMYAVQYKKYCSRSCSSRHRMIIRNKSADGRQCSSITHVNRNKSVIERALVSKNSWLSLCRKAGYNNGFLYICVREDDIKIGIAANNTINTALLDKRILCSKPIMHKVFAGTIQDIADTEYMIKLLLTAKHNNEIFNITYYDRIIDIIHATALIETNYQYIKEDRLHIANTKRTLKKQLMITFDSVQYDSISHASRMLHLSRSTISRRIKNYD